MKPEAEKKEAKKRYFIFVGEVMSKPKYTQEEKQALFEKLNIEQYPKNADGFYILPDSIFDEFIICLPEGTMNESGTKTAYNSGSVKRLTSNDTEIQRAGAIACNAKRAQRKSFAESVDAYLRKPARPEDIEKYNLPQSATMQDAMDAAIVAQAIRGNSKAYELLRDTVGEKPVDRQEISGNIITDADKSLIDKIQKRLDNMHNE